MFDDPRKELEQLQEQLLKDEEWFEKELDAAKRMIGQQPAAKRPVQTSVKSAPVRNYANGYGQSAPQPRRPQPVSEEEIPLPKPKGIRGPLTLAVIETLCIAGLAAYWVLFLLK